MYSVDTSKVMRYVYREKFFCSPERVKSQMYAILFFDSACVYACACAMCNSNSILFTFYLFFLLLKLRKAVPGTNGTSWGTRYCPCAKKAVPLSSELEKGR